MKTVKEVSRITGVSVRTLRYYDKINLLKPTEITLAGYRMYDKKAIQRLHHILLFKELQFSLKDIKEILDNPNFDLNEILESQIEILERQIKRTQKILLLARKLKKRGEYQLDFEVFDKQEIEKYKTEVKERWGDKPAYQEYREKSKDRTESEEKLTADQMWNIFSEIGTLRHLDSSDIMIQEKIRELKNFITQHYYTCTNEILVGLGQMYVEDERFKNNIDRVGGEGTAEFVFRGIQEYVRKKKD